MKQKKVWVKKSKNGTFIFMILYMQFMITVF